jgi:hypothetical protein
LVVVLINWYEETVMPQQIRKMSIANQLFNKAFHSTRDPRSGAYKAGVLDTLNSKESGSELKHPFAPGTAESDAWIAGNQEGHNIWRSEAEGDYKRLAKLNEIRLAKKEIAALRRNQEGEK